MQKMGFFWRKEVERACGSKRNRGRAIVGKLAII
ncbi:hypothetical protein CKC_00185 [Candidatus Liberibacter solanacearum CLso-ZC1]|uniref:Uncharacterized protein n=1 Tax=Liberibacter solanacearum (strain CLso-ZC1) TaxID=658172 RepID=E4UBP8_LIBSC|nr:hypothetical protein CKC_00185 [Candidatus Liberibacter solanacearum CLso-ZC1]